MQKKKKREKVVSDEAFVWFRLEKSFEVKTSHILSLKIFHMKYALEHVSMLNSVW